ncbi:MAG: MmgE/PrpD family protein [Betaproteobacteria bacterium]|nr:MmgE/PrpD family protein [Betaproteobacteria bacterium]
MLPVADPLTLLGRAAAGLSLQSLPAETVQRAKQRVLDTLGCLVAGYNVGISDAIRSYVGAAGGTPEATLLPGGQKTTVALVGLAHATYIHGLELSDAAPRGVCHPGNVIVPVALAMAERQRRGGADIIPAVVAGYEIEIRFGRTLFPSASYVGWWTPGLFGAIGPAVTASRLLGLNAEGIDNAIGIVVNLSPTAMGYANKEGNTIKWLIGGQACATGVLAAEMAARGTKGMRGVVPGWIPVISKDCHPERLTEGIRPDGTFEQWELLSGIVTKHYATVGPMTTPLDATFDLIAAHDIQADDIVEIHVDAMHRTAMFDKVHPETEIAARASLAYCLALAVVTRDPAQLLGPGYSDEKLRDKTIWENAEKVTVTESEEYERQYPARSLARVTLRLRDGKSYSRESDRSANGRYLRPTDEDIEKKFRLVATPILGKSRTGKVVALVRNLETLTTVDELIDALHLAPV